MTAAKENDLATRIQLKDNAEAYNTGGDSGRSHEVDGGDGFTGGGGGAGGPGGGGGYSGGGTDTHGGGGGSFVSSTFTARGVQRIDGARGGSSRSNGSVTITYYAGATVCKSKNTYYSSPNLVTVLQTGNFYLNWQNDGNLVLYENVSGSSTARWSTGTGGAGRQCNFQADGNLVIYNSNNQAVWGSKTFNSKYADQKGGNKLFLSPNGKLWIENVDHKLLWSGN